MDARRSSRSLVRYLQQVAAGLAVHGVGLVPLQPAAAGIRKTPCAGRKTACASFTKSEMPTIMATIDVSLPAMPGSMMSPKPVVVIVATVK